MAGCGWATASASLNTSTGNQIISVDCEGNTPKAALFFLTSAVVSNTVTNGRIGSWGMTDGTTHRCLVNMSENGALTAVHDTGRRQATNRILIATTTADETLDGDASFVSFGTDQVTINVEDAFGSAWIAIVWALYGDDLQVNLQDLTASATLNGTVSIAGLAFAPNLCFCIALPGGFSAAASANSRGSFGWAVKDGSGTRLQGNVAEFERDTPTISAACGYRPGDDSFGARFTVSAAGAATDEGQYEVTAFNADGIDVTTRTVGTACALAVMSIKTGGQRMWSGWPAVGVNSTGVKTITDPGWKAGFLAGIGTNSSTLNAINTGGEALYWSIGSARIGGTTRNASVYSEDAQNPSDSKSLLSTAFLEVLNGTTGATDWKIDTLGQDPSGFTLNVATASASDKNVLLLAMEARKSPGWWDARSGHRWRRCLARR